MGTITVSNLGKAYKQYPTHWDRFREWVSPGNQRYHSLNWVLRDLTFAVNAGEAVGIVGANGAGKSTLLKIIAGTTHPTTGKVLIEGRISAMLELGMGFRPDFTGRQNIYMAAQLQGISTHLISELMPEIEAFAEIGEYVDQPFRTYSSGMQMRLAFSVATSIRPDILIVDEALSVGDDYFQHKCAMRIREFRRGGTSLLIVSHDKQMVQSICDRAVLLNNGRLVLEASPEAVMDQYNAMLAQHQSRQVIKSEKTGGRAQTISGTGEATVEEIELLDASGRATEVVGVGQAVVLRVKVRVREKISRLIFGFGIKNIFGQVVYGTNTDHSNQPLLSCMPGDLFCFEIRFSANLGIGKYSIQTALHSTETHLVDNYEWRNLALIFSVVNLDKASFEGLSWIDSPIEVNKV